jgi:hypothetical protein
MAFFILIHRHPAIVYEELTPLVMQLSDPEKVRRAGKEDMGPHLRWEGSMFPPSEGVSRQRHLYLLRSLALLSARCLKKRRCAYAGACVTA